MKNKANRGITLVSLVVTIIILLILAGVTLALISGSDGILGRASHALDENKIAMAKEQVELALSDFQTEFFEGKYVERTNDGTKKEYISEKLQAGVETTNFYAQASIDENVTVYEGKDNSGPQVVKGTIEEDASIQWENSIIGSGGGNHNSGENTDSNNGRTSISDVLYEGTANKEGIYEFTFPDGKALEDYNMLYFFADAYYIPSNTWISSRIETSEALVNDLLFRNVVGFATWLTSGYEVWYSINSPKSFRIDAINISESNYSQARIYKVIGI